MRFNSIDISPDLAQLLERANRADLCEGFDLDDASVLRHRHACARTHSEKSPARRDAIAVYTALFDRTASHYATINPMAAPVPQSGSDELLKWVVNKQAETAQLDRNHADELAGRVSESVGGAADHLRETLIELGASLSGMSADGADQTVKAIEQSATETQDAFAAAAKEQITEAQEQARESRVVARDAITQANLNAAVAEVRADTRHAGQLESLGAIRAVTQSGVAVSKALLEEIRTQGVAETERYQDRASAGLRFHNLAEQSAAKRDRAAAIRHWIIIAVLLGILAAILAPRARAQSASPLVVQVQSGGTTLGTRSAGLLQLNCGTATLVGNKWTCATAGASGPSGPSGPAGANGATGASGVTTLDFLSATAAVTMTGSFVTVYSTTIPSLAASACLSITFSGTVTLSNAGDFKIFVDATQIAEPYNGASDITGILRHCNNHGVRNAQTTFYSPSFLMYSGGIVNSNGLPNQSTSTLQSIDWTTSHTVTLQIKAASGTATGQYWMIQ